MDPYEDQNTLFQKNLDRFASMCPQAAFAVEDVSCEHLQFCKTAKGELNLKKSGQEIYYHSQEGGLEEAQEWVEALSPLGIKVIILYGIGLGYIYEALKEWLSRDSSRLLFFIEDDLALLHRFLETENASRILKDSQVFIQYFPTPGETDWGKFRQQFEWSFWSFAGVPIVFEALPLYKKEHAVTFQLICGQVLKLILGRLCGTENL